MEHSHEHGTQSAENQTPFPPPAPRTSHLFLAFPILPGMPVLMSLPFKSLLLLQGLLESRCCLTGRIPPHTAPAQAGENHLLL